MTDTKPTLDEQIAYKKHVIKLLQSIESPRDVANEEAILASLERLKQIESAEMPVEPENLRYIRDEVAEGSKSWLKPTVTYIDALKAVIQRKEDVARDHLNDNAKLHGWLNDSEQAAGRLQMRLADAERERAALIAGLREIATCELKVKGDVVDIAKSLLWKHDK